MGICYMAQETQPGSLYQSEGVGGGGRWERVSRGRGYVYTYAWFMMSFDRKQQNSVKQLSFNNNKNKFKKNTLIHNLKVNFMVCELYLKKDFFKKRK